MNTFLQWTTSPLGGMLWKWTALLALGWVAHCCLKRGHPRWRLMLWRGILIFSLALPVTSLLSLPAVTIPVHSIAPVSQMDALEPALTPKTPATSLESISTRPSNPPVLNGTAVAPLTVEQDAKVPWTFPWKGTLLAVWALGCVCGAARLIWFHAQLTRLRGKSEEPPVALAELAIEIQKRLGVRRGFRLQISQKTQSPFVCGMWRPVIMLPTHLVETLSNGQITALLRHEMAHLRGNDLLWSAGWRWLQVIGWFHPLVWKVTAAHSFACEQEADRVACGPSEERESYAQFLAQLTLRVLALPKAETEMTLNGSAQIVRRLQHLQRAGLGEWTRKRTVVGLGLVVCLFLMAVGCKFAETKPEANRLPANGFKQVIVEVQDENGKPIEGAQITPFGFRVKGLHSPDAYGWRTNVFGPKETAITGPDGKAYLKYAVMGIPQEKEFTGALMFSVTHPDYSTVTIQDYPVDQTNAPIRIVRGATLIVSGYYGGRRVADLVPNLADDGVGPDDWQKQADCILVCHKVSPGGHLIQLMGRLPSGEIVYSGRALVTVTPGSAHQVMLKMKSGASGSASVMGKNGETGRLTFDMKPGIRLEGRLDDSVPRPVKNGRVMISIRPPEYPATNVIEDFYDLDAKNGGRNFWHSYRPINADGTFVFESVPPGEADVAVVGDGFATKSEGQLYNRVNGVLKKSPGLTIPQSFPLTAPVTQITVQTEPTATLEFTATSKKGQPIQDVWVGMFPAAFRMPGMYGWTKTSSEAPFRDITPLPDLRYAYSGKTGPDGTLAIRNIPAEALRSFDVDSEKYQVPLQDLKGWRDRFVRVRFEPGVTNKVVMVMEPKGTDYMGTAAHASAR